MTGNQAGGTEALAPTVRRRILARRLKALRQDRGLRLEEVARRLDVSTSKISRLENEAREPQVRDVVRLAEVYGLAAGEAAELVELANGARRPSRWRAFHAMAPERDYVELEAAAHRVRAADLLQVHGLAQTPAYTGATLDVFEVPNRAQIIESRAMRQQRLVSDDGPLELELIVGEAALRTRIGGAEVMRGQVEHLLTLSRRPNVVLQVMPLTAGITAAHAGSFGILEFRERELDRVVYLEGLTGQVVIDAAEQVERYASSFLDIGKQALTAEDSLDLLATLREHWS
jgi:transcriptional regulator with XRE-family HTH domain